MSALPARVHAALAARVNARLAAQGRFVVMRIHGSGLGDALCMSAAMRRVRERMDVRFVVVTRFPDLFLHHPHVTRIVDYPRLGFAGRRKYKWLLRHCAHGGRDARVAEFEYRPRGAPSHARYLADHGRPLHLAAIYTEHWGLPGGDDAWRCEVQFSAAERAAFAARFPAAGTYALIKPNSGSRWTANKDWDLARFQGVVDALPQLRWLQPGLATDPLLSGVGDLRGRTGLRELLYLVSRARLVLAPEGFYNHAAGAFDVPSFVLASGYATPQFAAYPNTRQIARTPQVGCAPCWLREPCPVPGKPCTGDIQVAQVTDAIAAWLATAAPHPAALDAA